MYCTVLLVSSCLHVSSGLDACFLEKNLPAPTLCLLSDLIVSWVAQVAAPSNTASLSVDCIELFLTGATLLAQHILLF